MSCDCGCNCNCNTVIQKGDIGPQGPQGPQGIQGIQGIQGAQGVSGENGRTILSGITAPSIGLGNIGDFYINTATDEIYGPKSGGGWGSPTSLIGPQGPPGPSGAGYEYEIGEYVPAQGGIVFERWVSGSDQNYLVIAMEDASTSVPFSNVTGTLITGADSYWDGETNTTDIIAQPLHVSSAAKDCVDYVNTFGTVKTDWYLPSITELTKLWGNMFLVSKSLDANGGYQIINNNDVAYPIYWSSTEAKVNTAWALSFATGSAQTSNKSVNEDVRAVRKFTYTP
jgi:hypothetical protein